MTGSTDPWRYRSDPSTLLILLFTCAAPKWWDQLTSGTSQFCTMQKLEIWDSQDFAWSLQQGRESDLEINPKANRILKHGFRRDIKRMSETEQWRSKRNKSQAISDVTRSLDMGILKSDHGHQKHSEVRAKLRPRGLANLSPSPTWKAVIWDYIGKYHNDDMKNHTVRMEWKTIYQSIIRWTYLPEFEEFGTDNRTFTDWKYLEIVIFHGYGELPNDKEETLGKTIINSEAQYL